MADAVSVLAGTTAMPREVLYTSSYLQRRAERACVRGRGTRLLTTGMVYARVSAFGLLGPGADAGATPLTKLPVLLERRIAAVAASRHDVVGDGRVAQARLGPETDVVLNQVLDAVEHARS